MRMSEKLSQTYYDQEKRNHYSIFERGINLEIFKANINIADNRMKELNECIEIPIKQTLT